MYRNEYAIMLVSCNRYTHSRGELVTGDLMDC
jgi:hypothetical protein